MHAKTLIKSFALFLLIWVVVAWYWYTCGIKGFCSEIAMTHDQPEKDQEVVSVDKRSDSGVLAPNTQR